jgi:hypothetical protein
MKKSIWILLFWAVFLMGEARCIYKAVTCNWSPIGKAEILYTASVCTGLGFVVGWINIKDE